MKTCSTCGNEIEDRAAICVYCESPQMIAQIIEKKVATRISIVKLKEGNPTVDLAMNRLMTELSAARTHKIKVIKIIHGYGSTGSGGAIKIALMNRLRELKDKTKIKTYVTGEQYNAFAGSRNYLLNKYPELKDTWVEDRGNPGITFIEI